jgi:hypothetical protein
MILPKRSKESLTTVNFGVMKLSWEVLSIGIHNQENKIVLPC